MKLSVQWLTALLLFTLVGVQSWASVAPTAPNYLQDALLNGRVVQRWNDQTTPIYVTLYSGSRIPGWNPAMNQAVQRSFAQWQQSMGGRVRFAYTTDPKMTDIIVMWRKYPGGCKIGQHQVTWKGTTMTHAEIQIAVYNPNGKPFELQEIQQISLHEIGHALGINGHSSNPKDIMYPSIQKGVTGLSARDLRTMQALYRLTPQITNPVGVHLGSYRNYDQQMQAGVASARKKDDAASYDNFKKAVSSNPRDYSARYMMAASAYNAKKYDEANATFIQLSQTPNPYQSQATFYVAEILMLQGQNALRIGNRPLASTKFQQAHATLGKALSYPALPADLRKSAQNQQALIRQDIAKI